MDDPLEYLTTVVRVFPDYADSVIWFAPGPVEYEDACLSDDLIRDLRAWDDRYYTILDDDHDVREEFRESFDADGLALAHRLSAELGDAFAVEYLSWSDGPTTLRGVGPASNPEAVAAFSRMAEVERADYATVAEGKPRGSILRWLARRPRA